MLSALARCVFVRAPVSSVYWGGLSSFPSVQLCLFLSSLPKPIKFAFSRSSTSHPPLPTLALLSLARPITLWVLARHIKGSWRRNSPVEGGTGQKPLRPGTPRWHLLSCHFFFSSSSLLALLFSPPIPFTQRTVKKHKTAKFKKAPTLSPSPLCLCPRTQCGSGGCKNQCTLVALRENRRDYWE